VGTTDIDGLGVSGLEKQHTDVLTGTPGRQAVMPGRPDRFICRFSMLPLDATHGIGPSLINAFYNWLGGPSVLPIRRQAIRRATSDLEGGTAGYRGSLTAGAPRPEARSTETRSWAVSAARLPEKTGRSAKCWEA
jgi:hypothetical protein